MSGQDRTDDGEFAAAVLPRDVLTVFQTVPGPVVTAGDVAEELDCSTETARRKLRSLRDDGLVDDRTAGSTIVWWLTSAGKQEINPDDPFWDAQPADASGPDDVSANVDEHLAAIERGVSSDES